MNIGLFSFFIINFSVLFFPVFLLSGKEKKEKEVFFKRFLEKEEKFKKFLDENNLTLYYFNPFSKVTDNNLIINKKINSCFSKIDFLFSEINKNLKFSDKYLINKSLLEKIYKKFFYLGLMFDSWKPHLKENYMNNIKLLDKKYKEKIILNIDSFLKKFNEIVSLNIRKINSKKIHSSDLRFLKKAFNAEENPEFALIENEIKNFPAIIENLQINNKEEKKDLENKIENLSNSIETLKKLIHNI